MPLPRISPRQLEIFVAVAEAAGFRAAAERTSLTPSAVSQLVSELESIVGVRLFERTTRKVALTVAGREFLGPARTCLRHLHLAEQAANNLRLGSSGVVRIAAPQVLASVVLPRALKAFQSDQPKVVVRIRDLPVDNLALAVSNGDADLGFGPDQAIHLGVDRFAVFDSPWVLWCRPEHPLAQREVVEWCALRAHPFVVAGRDHEHSVPRMGPNLPADERIVPIDVVEHVATALGMAVADLAVTLSPAYVAALARPLGLVMRSLVDPAASRLISLCIPSGRELSPAAHRLFTFLREWIPENLPEGSSQTR